MSEMMRMDAFSDNLLGDQEMHDSKESHSPEHYITWESRTATKFAEAMKEACRTKKDVQITVELKDKYTSWKAICDAYIKEIFDLDPRNLAEAFPETIPQILVPLGNMEPYFKVKDRRSEENNITFQITFLGSDYDCIRFYEHLDNRGKYYRNFIQRISDL